jgi:hypothetical protein
MPFYYPSLNTVDKHETKRNAGLTQQANISSELLDQACLQAQLLSIPKGVWHLHAYDQDEHTIIADKPVQIIAPGVICQLSGAVEVAILAVTIGLALEQEVSNLFIKNKADLGLLLDAAGTTAVDFTYNTIYNIISQQAAPAGLIAGSCIRPGHGDCPLDMQAEVLQLATGTSIGLSLTDTKRLVPRKSITAIIGLYPYHHNLSLPHQQELLYNNSGRTGCQARKEKQTK